MVKKSDLVGEVSHLRKMAYFLINLPWPFEKREAFLRACGVMLKEDKTAVISMCSVTDNQWLGIPINRSKKFVTMDIHRAFAYAKVLGEKETLVKFVFNVDAHIKSIPQWLINMVIKGIFSVFIKYIAKKAKNLPDEYAKLIESKPEFYKELMAKLSELQ